MTKESLMDIVSCVGKPISADNPTGADVRYDPMFEALQAELDKLSSLSATGTVDWGKVVHLSSDILANKSKDLLVASYLAVGLIYTQRYDGLSVGIQLLMELMGKYWNDLYPTKERMRRRVRSIEWWVEKSATALKQLPSSNLSQTQARFIMDNLEQFERLLMQNFNEMPSLLPLHVFVNALNVKSERPEADVSSLSIDEPVASKDHTANENTASSERKKLMMEKQPLVAEPELTESEALHSPQHARKMLERGWQALRDGANYLWLQDTANPVLYRLNRVSIWVDLEGLPAATDNRTKIPPPDKQTVKMISEMRNSVDPETMLQAAEGRIGQYIFWLDLHCFVAGALLKMGDGYRKAHDCVCNETAFFLHRLHGLEDYTFSDGMPFANQETRTWIQNIAFNSRADCKAAAKGRTSLGQDSIVIEVAGACDMVRKGELLDALSELQSKLSSAPSLRERVLWRQAIVGMLINANKIKLALPHLEQIILEIDTYRLEEYEPELAVQGLRLVWMGYHSCKDPSLQRKAVDILYRIGRLDMVEVALLDKS